MSAFRERFLQALLMAASDYAIVAADRHGLITVWSEGARLTMGWTEAEALGRPIQLFFTEEDCANSVPEKEMSGSIAEGRAVDERWHLHRDGTLFWANGEMVPLRDADGAHIGFLKILRDRTERRLEAERQRTESEFMRGVLAASADCIKVLDLDGKIVFMSEGGMKVMEVTDLGAVLGRHWPDQWKDSAREQADAALSAAKSEGIGRLQAYADTFAGRTRFWDVQITAMRDAQGRPERLLCISRDVTAQRQAEEQARLLGDELQHRVKNTLAMVQAIVHQGLRRAATPAEAEAAIDPRLAALARAHDLLTGSGWQQSDLQALIEATLQPHDDGRKGRFVLSGPPAQLSAQSSLSLGLLLHELSTNAVKYGALSTDAGQVVIGWTREPMDDGQAQLHLVWRENGGPPVAMPTRRGFGSRLIERGLSGGATLEFAPGGLVCTVDWKVER